MHEKDRTHGLELFDSNIGSMLRTSRKSSKTPLTNFAKHIGISADYLSRVERAIEPADPEVIDLYCEEFKIPPSRLFLVSRAFIAGLDLSGTALDGSAKALKKLEKIIVGIDALKEHCHIPK